MKSIFVFISIFIQISNIMKYFYSLFLVLISTFSLAQTITIVSPEDLTPPYEVAPNTAVTFKWDYFESPPTSIFTYSEEPDFSSQPGANPAWNEYSSYTDNGDGTFNFTVTVDEEMWIWAGNFQPFLGSYAFSNVFHFSVASGVIITAEDGMLCPDGTDTELLSVADTFPSYQWYRNNASIDGAMSANYSATEPGSYKVQVPADTNMIYSNTLVINEFSLEFGASYNALNSELTFLATPGFDNYQWYSGVDSTNMSPVNGANDGTLTVPLPGQVTYFAVEASNASCTLMSSAREVLPSGFAMPEITVAADTNSFGNICAGTTVALSTDTIYGSYLWEKDGQNAYNSDPVLLLSQNYQSGNYTVEVTPPGWPEISLVSTGVDVEFMEVVQPELFSDDSDNKYCPGQTVNITLSDEGYDYTWYAHTDMEFTEDDIVTVPGNTYTFTYDTTMRVSVVGAFEGCTNSRTITLNSWAQQSPYISLVDYNDQYLCTDSVAEIQVSPFSADDFSNYQWGQWVEDEFIPISGATASTFSAADTGDYIVRANPASCPSVTVYSNVLHVGSYLDRSLNIYADPSEICLGDTTEISISGGSYWQDIQWFEQDINGFNTDELQFNPIIGAGNSATQEVSDYKRYRVKARFTECPTGEKINSNIVAIRPRVNPALSFTPDYGVYDVNTSPYDSIAQRLYCVGEDITISATQGYDSYQWLATTYSALNYYTAGGDPIAGANEDSLVYTAEGAEWITLQVDSAGCAGYSDPVLIDTWVFQSPTIESYGNSELCNPGDSVLLNLGFAGEWISYQWFLDGVPIPNTNNDSIYASEPGMYVVETVPAQCPDFSYSSGVGPVVSYLDASIEENDSVIYALPQLGIYTYQWYLDGEPISAPSNTPWLLYKASMEDGVYTVDVTNPDSCTSTSDPYTWNTTGTEDLVWENLHIYPNPANDEVYINGINDPKFAKAQLFDVTGKRVLRNHDLTSNSELDVSALQPGVYILKIELEDGRFTLRKLVKE